MLILRKALIFVIVVTPMLLSPIAVGGEDENKKIAAELAGAVHQYMIATYGCQKYLGGLGVYRAAKLEAEEIFIKMGTDRNKAVLLIQKGEDEIKSESPNIEMENMVAQNGISEVDAKSGCQTTVADAMDRVKVLQAKLGLL